MRHFIFASFLVSSFICQSQTFEEYISSFPDREMQMHNYNVFQVYDRGVARYYPGGYEALQPSVYGPNNYSDVVNILEYIGPDNIFVASFNIPTTAKLKRFNGVEWLDFQPALPNGAMKVSDILYRSESEIYVAAQNLYTQTSLVYKFDGTQWVDLNLMPFGHYPPSLFYISSTEIYLTTAGQLAVYNGEEWSIIDHFGITTNKIFVDVVDADHKYVTGRHQLLNFANGTMTPVGNILLPNESQNDVTVTHVQAIANDNIYIAAKIYVGFSNATFVSHWDGSNWERMWTFDPSNQVDDYPTYLFEENGNIFVKIFNRPMFAYLPNFVDDDGDGVANNEDADPADPYICRDLDADGCDDCSQTGNNGSGGNTANDGDDFDNDGLCDYGDLDDDNDGVPDLVDAFPFDPNEDTDTDGDGIGNNADPDDDNDGQRDIDELACGSDPLDENSLSPDLDIDGIPDCVDDDIDGDGYSNAEEIDCGSNPYDPSDTCETAGMGENSIESIKIYPNPSTGIYTITSALPIAHLVVYSINGSKIRTLEPQEPVQHLDLSHLPKGIYLLKIKTQTGTAVKKLIRK
ncbi:T9SS type A sorting domain-containing protein [Aequorivita vladivostokensis]|uniref:T9SS type A sorting domain-containing protein n=1 Tax=Aequorivita vladivostokensis TaxID=171194 RepID=UPI0005D3F013|nr:T9SS type A sorting domain-containing protein [Aequorivita vladivostokensis]